MAPSLKQEASLSLHREGGMAEQMWYLLLSQQQESESLTRLNCTLPTPKCVFCWPVCASWVSGHAGTPLLRQWTGVTRNTSAKWVTEPQGGS